MHRYLWTSSLATLALTALVSNASLATPVRRVTAGPIAVVDYTVAGLATAPGYQSVYPASVNDADQTVAWECCNAAQPYPIDTASWLFVGDRSTSLGLLPGFSATSVSGINAMGLAVGTAVAAPPPGGTSLDHTHAVAFTTTGVVDLGVLPGYSDSGASGVNAAGDAIGYSFATTLRPSVTLFRHGRTIRLGDGWGSAINNAGVAIGTGLNGFATLFSERGTRSLGSFVARNAFSYGYAINNRGIAVGYAGYVVPNNPQGFQHAFVSSADGLHDLGVPAGNVFSTTVAAAYGINDLNEIVGYYLPGAPVGVIGLAGPPTAFIYADGVMRNLNDLLPPGSGWTLVSAAAINDCGDIVGQGVYAGVPRAFILRRTRLDRPQLRYALGCRR